MTHSVLAKRGSGVHDIAHMISFLRGTVAESRLQSLVLDVGGVGYEVLVTLTALDQLNPVIGQELQIKTHLHVRDNIRILYGFATDAERDVFKLLIDRVSGIGPSTAMSILSGLSVDAFKSAVAAGDVTAIARAKGVGKKTAERIVLELKDKVGLAATWQSQQEGSTSLAAADAELALIALGFKQVDARKAIAAHLKDSPDANTDELIRASLRRMS